jgi:KUP system potassium uptake protein
MITGLFSIMTQAYALKFLPRIKVLHTNPDEPGQVYIPEANWALCVACVAITIAFKSSAKLTGAYGIAVTSTFLVTTVLLWIVIRRVWKWHVITALLVIIPLFIVDAALWSSNMLKIVDSGWVPVVISILMCLLMHTHFWGRQQEENVMSQEATADQEELRTGHVSSLTTLCTVPALQAALCSPDLVRGERAVVFMTPHELRVPRTVGALASLLGYLPKVVVLLSVKFESIPFVSEDHRSSFKTLGDDIYSVVVHFGYAEPLTVEQFSIRSALARVVKDQCGRHPSLRMLVAQAAVSSDANEAASGGVTSMEEGHGPFQQIQQGHGPTFVLHKLHYATQADAKHGLWDCLRIKLYSFIVLNARQSISFFGLEGRDTMEISVVRFL